MCAWEAADKAATGGRGGRLFGHGGLRLVLLQLIGDKPSHGYELIKAIEERVQGTYSPSPGVVYPTLTLLEELGQVSISATEGARKRYAITDEGRAFLAANRPAVDALLTRMDESGPVGGRPPQVIRAIENLRLAVRMRLARAPLADAQIDAIADTLDAAARQIERL
jgi:DNA-binding PadR family transcriptional regulator